MMWHGVVWCGMVWCGVAWCGVVWHGVVWYGTLRVKALTAVHRKQAHSQARTRLAPAVSSLQFQMVMVRLVSNEVGMIIRGSR